MKKRGEVSPLAVVIGAIILLIVAAVLIAIFLKQTGTGSDIIKGTFEGLEKDADGDGLVNQVDKCPCDSGTEEASGCPANFEEIRTRHAKCGGLRYCLSNDLPPEAPNCN